MQDSNTRVPKGCKEALYVRGQGYKAPLRDSRICMRTRVQGTRTRQQNMHEDKGARQKDKGERQQEKAAGHA